MTNKVYNVFGLGYGDEGKGTIVESLARMHEAIAVIRYNGGPQAAHHVVESGRFHCFSQFGSGTLIPDVRTHLTSSVLVKPQNLLAEAQALAEIGIPDALARITISPDAYLVTPLHAMIGQMLEASRGVARHGSVGMGVGRAAQDRSLRPNDSLRISDFFLGHRELSHRVIEHFAQKLSEADEILSECQTGEAAIVYQSFRQRITVEKLVHEYQAFADMLGDAVISDTVILPELSRQGAVILEGAQGVLLDPQVGFAPHVTKTTVLPQAAAETLAHLGAANSVVNVGVIRAFSTRHGAGPFVTEASLPHLEHGEHNQTNRWQGGFRYGHLDLVATRYAIESAKQVDALAVTCLDRLANQDVLACTSYRLTGENADAHSKYFDLSGGRDRTARIIPNAGLDADESASRTRCIVDCCPGDSIRFKTWPVSDTAANLHQNTGEFIQYLESSEGLDTPVAIISGGPTAQDKHHILDI